MKNKKKLCIIGVSALCIVVAVVFCITLIPKHNGDKPAESEAKETSSGTIVIDEPEKDTQSDETKNITKMTSFPMTAKVGSARRLKPMI